MNNQYKGTIIEESLIDSRVLNDLNVVGFKITEEDDQSERWHIYSVMIDSDDIDQLSKNIKPGWYMHFWQGRDVIAVFAGKTFEFDYDDKATWEPAIEYGLSVGIPREQLDFLID